MSESQNNQNWSKISLRLPDNLFRDFRVALALKNETAQDVLTAAVLEYVKRVELPADTLIGKQ